MEMHPDSPEEIFVVFIFMERMCNDPVYQLMATPHERTEEMILNDEVKNKLVQQWPSLPFMWRDLLLQKFQDCCRGGKIAEGNSTANLNFDNFGVFLWVFWHFVY